MGCWISAIVPQLSAITCLGNVPRPSACLDMVTRPSACLDTMSRPSAMTCLGKVPWSSACLEKVSRPSAIPSKGASTKCHDKPRQGASA